MTSTNSTSRDAADTDPSPRTVADTAPIPQNVENPAVVSIRPEAAALARDLRLVVCDMDGTLLDENGRIPEDFWPLLDELNDRGIGFVPASGRQYATLADMFSRGLAGMPIIAENGSFVVRDGSEVHSSTLSKAEVADVVERSRALGRAELGVVVCGKRTAHVESTSPFFLDNVSKYYVLNRIERDLLAIDDDVLKVALFDAENAREFAFPLVEDMAETHDVVISGENWTDVMVKGTNKGGALRALQRSLGVSPAQTAVFGDYLNDYEMMAEAELSFAMANAHPDLMAAARFTAPSNAEHGVLNTLRALLASME